MNKAFYPDFLKLWDFHHIDETRTAFIACKEKQSLSDIDKLQLDTQIARTYSLQQNFIRAHEILDSIKDRIKIAPVVELRYLLERGRCYNSAGKKSEALELFIKAWDIGIQNKIDGLAVDAAHMVAIAETNPDQQLGWNLKALELANTSDDPRAKQWRGSLYNNIGWTYFDRGNLNEALNYLKDCYQFRLEQDASLRDLNQAKWCVARVYREIGEQQKALAMQVEIFQSNQDINFADGFNFEELAELYYDLNDINQAKEFAKKALEHLLAISWVASDQDRIERLRKIADARI